MAETGVGRTLLPAVASAEENQIFFLGGADLAACNRVIDVNEEA